MAANAQITITTEATEIFGATDPDGASVILRVMGTTTVYLGNASVATDNGMEIENDDGVIVFDLAPFEALYGIVAADTGKVCYLATKN